MPTTTKRNGVTIVIAVAVVAALGWLAWSRFGGSGDGFSTETETAAAWIAREFDQPTPDWEDFGPAVYADIAIGLTGAGVEEDTADAALATLAVLSDQLLGTPGSAPAGAVGKVVLAIEARGENPATYIPERDVEAELRGMLGDDGRFADDVYNQSLAILGLAATDDGVPDGAGDWLASKQCDTGDFTFAGDCPAEAGSEDPDTTAVALQALLATGETEAAVAATAWLLMLQAEDGSISSFGTANANSTAAVAQALRAAGEADAADRAAAFVATLQIDAPGEAEGGIRFSAADSVPNGYATIQGMLAFGAPAYDEIGAMGPPPRLAIAAAAR
ncbi:MAG: hypothetical protein ACR2JP_11100 [Acidimicrobiia bacterium]